jgi:hypothetical protein
VETLRTLRRAHKPGPTVDILEVRPHGADLIFARGTVDGVAVAQYFPVADLNRCPPDARRRCLASKLRALLPEHAPTNLTGREENVW